MNRSRTGTLIFKNQSQRNKSNLSVFSQTSRVSFLELLSEPSPVFRLESKSLDTEQGKAFCFCRSPSIISSRLSSFPAEPAVCFRQELLPYLLSDLVAIVLEYSEGRLSMNVVSSLITPLLSVFLFFSFF
jgi:hypothetical protein